MQRRLVLAASMMLLLVGCGDGNDGSGESARTDNPGSESIAEPGLDIGQQTQLIIRFDEATPAPRMQQLMQELAPPGEPTSYSLSYVPEEFQIQVGSLSGDLDDATIEEIEDKAENYDEVIAVDRL